MARRFEASQQWPAAILFYHRVANSEPNGWSIGCKDFSDQLDFVASIAKFASLDEIRQSQHASVRQQRMIAITFDDGYGENLDWAIPELVRRNIPCTYFVTTDNVEHELPFQHDVKRNRPLRPNTISEIQAIADAGIQIGGHTQTHLDLGKEWPVERLRAELCDSRKKLQDWTGQPIDFFAIPYGLQCNITQAAIDIIAEAGYRSFLSAFGEWNFLGGDDFHLCRFHGDACTEAVRNWLTFDPRRMKQRKILNYRFPTMASNASDSSASGDSSPTAFPTATFPINSAYPTYSNYE